MARTIERGELTYVRQDCPKTLREALDEYFSTIDGLVTEDNSDRETAELFRAHDLCHVVFGCRTTPAGEALVDVWSWVATTATARELAQYSKNPAARAIFREYGYLNLIGLTLCTVPLYFLLIWRAFRMTRKWPWRDNERYLDVPLVELRRELNLKVISSRG